MTGTTMPAAVTATDAPPRVRSSNLPSHVERLMDHHEKRALGAVFELGNFGVNLTGTGPGGVSALMHGHGLQDGSSVCSRTSLCW